MNKKILSLWKKIIFFVFFVFYVGNSNVFALDGGNLSSSSNNTYGILPNNTLVRYGYDFLGNDQLPAGEFKSVSAGTNFVYGIKIDNTLAIMGTRPNGDGDFGQRTVPTGEFKSISVGTRHVCGIKMDNTIMCWGKNESLQSSPPTGEFKSISVGTYNGCGIKIDNSVACWGSNFQGISSPPSGKYKIISLGTSHACGLKDDNTIVCWGSNSYNALNHPTGEFKSISSGWYHSCGIKIDNSVTCWGYNNKGILDTPTGEFKSISSGIEHVCGIKIDNSVACWGSNTYGKMDIEGLTLRSGQYQDLTENYNNPLVSLNKPKNDNISGLTCRTQVPYIGEICIDPVNKQEYHYADGKIKELTNNSESTQDAADPVNIPTGEFTYDNTLMNIPGRGINYSLDISYKNQTYYNGPVGINFDHNYNLFLNENEQGGIDYYNGKLGKITFSKDVNGNYEYQVALKAKLEKSGEEYIINYDNGNKEIFGSNLRIREKSIRTGDKLSFEYNTDNQLIKVIDTLGRSIIYSYYGHSRLYRVTDFNGRTVTFDYFTEDGVNGSQFDLKNLTINNGGNSSKTINFTYTTDNSGNKDYIAHNILNLYDSKGNLYVENTYDDKDRAISQKYGNGTVNYEYTKLVDDSYTGTLDSTTPFTQTKVTNRNGTTTTYIYNNKLNTIKRNVTGKNGEFTQFKFEYDENSNLTKEIKPNGNVIVNKYDSRGNLVEKRQRANPTINDDNLDIVVKYVYDETFNKPVEITKPDGSKINFTLDEKGNITKIETKGVNLGNTSLFGAATDDIVVNNEYDNNGQLIKTTDPEGNVTTFTYENGLLVKVAKLSKDRGGMLGMFENSDKDIIETYKYDVYGNVVEKTDAEGNKTTLTYNEYSNLVSSLTAEGIEKKYIYDLNNNLLSETTSNGMDDISYSGSIDGDGNFIDATGELNPSTKYIYDLLDHPVQILSQIDKNTSNKVIKKYDGNENITELIYENGTKQVFEYNEFDRAIKKSIWIKNDSGDYIKYSQTEYIYDKNGNLIQNIDPKGTITKIEYDNFDRAIKTIDPQDNYSTISYDKLGNIVETITFNENNKLLNYSKNIYNSLGNILKTESYMVDNNGNIGTPLSNSYKYNKNSRITESTDAKGNKSQVVYDEFGRIIETIDSINNKTKSIYNKRGLVIEKQIIGSDNTTLKTNYEYDKDGRLIKETNNDGKSKIYVYNKLNQVIQTTDANGNKIDYTYNYIGKITSETNYLSGSTILTKYDYDKFGNLIKLTDGNNNETKYEYDSLSRLVKEIYPDNKVMSYEYDISGNVIKTIDPNGNIVSNTYDIQNRLIERNIITGSGVIGVTKEMYSYDSIGRLISANDSDNNILSFNYDSFNRLISEVNGGKEIKYGYDELGNRTSVTLPSNKVVKYEYDNISRMNKIILNNNTETDNTDKLISNYTYNGINLKEINYGNGIKSNYTYDNLLRLKSLSYTGYTNPLADQVNLYKNYTGTDITKITLDNVDDFTYNYSYDDIGNITSKNNEEYEYDNIGRITSSKYNTVILSGSTDNYYRSFTYDNLGNRVVAEDNIVTTKIEDGTISTVNKLKFIYSTNNLNQYTVIANKTGKFPKNYTYDENGNLKEDSKKYIYDYKNRLVEVRNKSDNSLIESYSYDVLGRRISKKCGTYTELNTYIYSGEDIIEEKYETSDKTRISFIKEYIYGADGIDDVVAMIKNDNIYYFLKNNIGSIVAITDKDSKIVEQYKYDEFGKTYYYSLTDFVRSNPRVVIGKRYGFVISNIEVDNYRLFTGREYDIKSGLYYYRSRYYSAEIGRFVSRDPIGTNDQINLYTYVGNNPVIYVDPDGKTKKFLKSRYDKYIEFLYGMRKGDNLFDRLSADFSLGVFVGDYVKEEDQSVGSTVGQFANGFTPAGIAADGRDFKAAWESGDKVRIGFAGVAFIPLVGDGAKAGYKGSKATIKEIEIALSNESNVQHAYRHLTDEFGKRNKINGEKFKNFVSSIMKEPDEIIEGIKETRGGEDLKRFIKKIEDTVYQVDIFKSGKDKNLIRTTTKH